MRRMFALPALLAATAMTTPAAAQDAASGRVDDLQAKIELLQAQVEALKEELDAMKAQQAQTAAAPSWKGAPQLIDKVICHQVGRANRDSILASIGIDTEKDFSTFPYLGNTGTVSVPMTAAIAEEREFLKPGDRVAWLGIGSGLNCLMLGMEW